MTKAFVLSCILVLLGHAAGPDAKWLKLIGGSNNDRAYTVAVDRDGNAYLTGQFYSTNVAFDTHVVTGSGGSMMFVAKFDRFGSNVWVATGGSDHAEGHGVGVDENGNVYVSGDTWGSSPQIFGTTNLTPNASSLFLAKFDSNGQFQWVRQGRGLNGFLTSTPLTIAGTNIYVAGKCGQGVDFGTAVVTNTSIFLAIYDFDGNVVAARTLANAPILGGYAWQVAVDGNGNYYTGLFFDSQTIFFGGTNVNRVGGQNTVLTKWDATGNLLWFQHLSARSAALCSGITLAPNGELLVVGRAIGSGSFAGQPVNDAFLARLTSAGDFVWLNNIATNNVSLQGVASDLGGNSFICGFLPSGVSILSGHSITNNSTNYSPFAARLDTTGNLSWALCGTATSSADYSEAHSIAVDPSGAAYVAGYVGNSMQFGSKSAEFHGNWDIFLARLAPDSPPLRIQLAGDGVMLSWPTNQLGFVLEWSLQLGSTWTQCSEPGTRNGANFTSTNRMTNGVRFFRLRDE